MRQSDGSLDNLQRDDLTAASTVVSWLLWADHSRRIVHNCGNCSRGRWECACADSKEVHAAGECKQRRPHCAGLHEAVYVRFGGVTWHPGRRTMTLLIGSRAVGRVRRERGPRPRRRSRQGFTVDLRRPNGNRMQVCVARRKNVNDARAHFQGRKPVAGVRFVIPRLDTRYV